MTKKEAVRPVFGSYKSPKRERLILSARALTRNASPYHTEQGLTHSRAGNALPTHASGLAYKYRQGLVVL